MQNNERLLKLYESGLPAWAIYMPLYRLPYRPWMRKVHQIVFSTCSHSQMRRGDYFFVLWTATCHHVIAHEQNHGVQATYCLFILVSVLSLVIGYYDIIKNVPLFRKVGRTIYIRCL